MMIKVVMLLFLFSYTSVAAEIKWFSYEKGVSEAKKRNKYILMDVYAKWCHWCNVIENTTYRDEKVIKIINKYYIPIRIDVEKRPDLNKRFNQGGLPSTVIFDKNMNKLYGISFYIAPEDMSSILLYFAKMKPEKIKKQVELIKLNEMLTYRQFEKKLKEKRVTYDYINKIYHYVKSNYDVKYGGLKAAHKFPLRQLPYFLTLYSIFQSNNEAKDLAEKTFYAYSKLIDQIEGGSYRYSVNKKWTKFHYEKLLKDQAELAIMYFNAYALDGNKDYLYFANTLLKFTKNRLYDKKSGLFYNSQGADIVDNNGTLLITGEEYFTKDRIEREKIKKKLGFSPRIEKKFYFTSNSLIISALVYSYFFNNSKEDLLLAERIAKKILENGWKKYGIIHSVNLEKYYLITQVYFLEALLNLYQATGDTFFLQKSKILTDVILELYYSNKLGIYTDLNDIGINIKNISFIDDIIAINSRFVKQLYILSVFTSNKYYWSKAKELVRRLPKGINLDTALAYFVVLYNPTVIHIVGFKKDSEKYVRNLFKIFPYYNFIQFVYVKNKNLIKSIGYKPYKQTVFYLCNISMCYRRFKVDNLKEIKKKLFNIYRSYKNE